MSEIKRYECDGYTGQVWMEDKVLGDYVKYEDHLAIVEVLKAEIASLKKEFLEAYNLGYDEGRWIGYHELNQNFDQDFGRED